MASSTNIQDLLRISTSPFVDSRGSFTRVYDKENTQLENLGFHIENVNLSINPNALTLRGFHYSVGSPKEHKLFICVEGEVINFTIDMRPSSPTYLNVVQTNLSAKNNQTLMVPGGCANAWMTLAPNTRIIYLVSSGYDRSRERGLCYNDPYFSIPWPSEPKYISQKDLSWPNFDLAQ